MSLRSNVHQLSLACNGRKRTVAIDGKLVQQLHGRTWFKVNKNCMAWRRVLAVQCAGMKDADALQLVTRSDVVEKLNEAKYIYLHRFVAGKHDAGPPSKYSVYRMWKMASIS